MRSSVMIEGRTAFITGAGRGIGRAAAMLFASQGARVVVADIDAEQGLACVDAMHTDGHDALFVQTDVTNPASVAAAIQASLRAYGRLDILYNNAGGSRADDRCITQAPDEAFWATIRLDLYGSWNCCRHAIPEMIRSGGGTIINSASITALKGHAGKDSYTAAKGAIAALTRSMAVEYASAGIRVNALAPGITLTDRISRRLGGVEAGSTLGTSLLDRHLLGLIEPEHVARAALFLASDMSSHITGQILPVDSGFTIA